MEKLVMDHSYSRGTAWDLSRYRHHGEAFYTSRQALALYFEGPSAIRVPVTNFLGDIQEGFRAGISFRPPIFHLIDPYYGGVNLLLRPGGPMLFAKDSFQVYMTQDFGFVGILHNGSNTYKIESLPGAISFPNPPWALGPQHLEFRYDGVSSIYLKLNDVVLAARHDVEPPPNMKSDYLIGSNAPQMPPKEGDGSFWGLIYSAYLYVEDSAADWESWTRCCEFDHDLVSRIVETAKKNGMTPKKYHALRKRIQNLLREIRQAYQNREPARILLEQRLGESIATALKTREPGALQAAVRGYIRNNHTDYTKEQGLHLLKEMLELVDQIPVELKDIWSVLEGSCELELLIDALLVEYGTKREDLTKISKSDVKNVLRNLEKKRGKS